MIIPKGDNVKMERRTGKMKGEAKSMLTYAGIEESSNFDVSGAFMNVFEVNLIPHFGRNPSQENKNKNK
jgi:hypothetical protein